MLAAQTGLRVSELTGLTIGDYTSAAGAHVDLPARAEGPRTPLTAHTVQSCRSGSPTAEARPARCSRPSPAPGCRTTLSPPPRRSRRCRGACPSLQDEDVPRTPCDTRRPCPAGSRLNVTVIALWLGHESRPRPGVYLHADMALKEQAIARTTPPNTPEDRATTPPTLCWPSSTNSDPTPNKPTVMPT